MKRKSKNFARRCRFRNELNNYYPKNKVEIPISEIAKLLDAEIIGDATVKIKTISGINEAEEGHLTFVIDQKYLKALKKTKASAVLISADIECETDIPQIRIKDPKKAFEVLTKAFAPPEIEFPAGVHETAIVADDAILGENVSVQAYAVIEPGVTIGDNCVIGAHSYIGHYTTIGSNVKLYPRVTIRERIKIGNNIIIHPGVVIGADGFGFDKGKNGRYTKIPQIGSVIIEDDVEIGANTTIDRARFDNTIIHRGTKVDNLVQIAHNVEIGENSILCAQAGISGSTKIGKNVILAGQAGLAGHINVCDNVIFGAQAGVPSDIKKPGFYLDTPAKPHMEVKRRWAERHLVSASLKKVKELEKRLNELIAKK